MDGEFEPDGDDGRDDERSDVPAGASDDLDADAGRPLMVGCEAWLRGVGRAFPRRLQRGTVNFDDAGLVWRSARRWYPPVALDGDLIDVIGQRPLRFPEGLWVDRDCTVLVLRYLTVHVELAVRAADAPLLRAAVRRHRDH